MAGFINNYTAQLGLYCLLLIIASASNLLCAASTDSTNLVKTESKSAEVATSALGHSSYSRTVKEASATSVATRTLDSIQQSLDATESWYFQNVTTTNSAKQQKISSTSLYKQLSFTASSPGRQEKLTTTTTVTQTNLSPTVTWEQQRKSVASTLSPSQVSFSGYLLTSSLTQMKLMPTNSLSSMNSVASNQFNVQPITSQKQQLLTADSVHTTSHIPNTRGNATAAQQLSQMNYDSMSSNIQATEYKKIRDSSSFDLINSYLQVGSISQTTRSLSNINFTQIQSTSAFENKKQHTAQSSHFTTPKHSVFNMANELKTTGSSLFKNDRSVIQSTQPLLSTSKKSAVVSAFALVMLTSSLPVSLSQVANNTSMAIVTTSSIQHASSINVNATASSSMMQSPDDVYSTRLVTAPSGATSLKTTPYQATSPTSTPTTSSKTKSISAAHTSSASSKQLSTSPTSSTKAGFTSESSTYSVMATSSASLAPAATLSPFVRDQYLIFSLSGVLENETFHQSLTDRSTQNFTLLAARLGNELRTILNTSTGFVKAEVLNFTKHGNSVLFTSKLFYNVSANITANSVKINLESNSRKSYVISNISVKELCSTASCSGHGTCNRILKEITCSCQIGYEGVRCHIAYPVDGNYTEWSAYQSCSKSCNEGVQLRTRTCTNPSPIHGGKNCSMLGLDKEARKCNLKTCIKDDWIMWLIIAAVCFIVLFALILGCCFVKKAKYYYRSYGMTPDGRSYNLRKQAYTNEAYEAQLSEFRTESTVVPLKVLKEDPFKNTYANADTLSTTQPKNGSANDVYQRELKSFLNNTHHLRVKEDDGEYLEPEVNYHSNRPMANENVSPVIVNHGGARNPESK